MLIKQILNNNVLLVENKHNQELIVWGRGIGFHAHSGQNYTLKTNDKIFSQIPKDDGQWLEGFKKLSTEIPGEYFELTEKVIQIARKEIDASFDDHLLAPLTDHMFFAVKRFKMGLELTNPMLFDIKKFFPQEYKVGKRAKKLLQKLSHVKLTDDESGFIAIHLVEHELKSSNSLINNFTDFVVISNGVTQIIENNVGKSISEDSIAMTRLMTHLRFLLLRKRDQKEDKKSSSDTKLLHYLILHHQLATKCLFDVINFLEAKINFHFQDSDRLYLLIHLIHITE